MSASSSLNTPAIAEEQETLARLVAWNIAWASAAESAAMTLTPAITCGASSCAEGRNSRR